MRKLLLSILTITTIGASAQLSDSPVSSTQSNINIGDSTDIIVTGTDKGANYYLLNNNNGDTITGPIFGTGSDLIISTGVLNTTTTFGVFAENRHSILLQTNYDYIDFTTAPRNIDTTVSIAAWINTTNTSLRNIVLDYGGLGGDAGYILRISNNGKAEISGRDGSGAYKTSGPSSTTVTDGNWHYLVGTANVNTGVWKIYVDGALQTTAYLTTGTSMANTQNLYIGHAFSSSNAFVGVLRDVTIWNSELTVTDISANMNLCLSGSEANIVGHFKLNEGRDTTIFDHSSYAIDGITYFSAPLAPIPNWFVDSTQCSDSLTMTQTATVSVSPVGIDEESNHLDLTTYPNPTSGKVTFSTSISGLLLSQNVLNDRIELIEIYNLTGQQVATFNNVNTIDISNLPSGMYIAKVIAEQQVGVVRLIKE